MLDALKSLLGGPRASAGGVDALYSEAVTAWNAGDYGTTLRSVDRAIAVDASLPTLHFLKASAHLELSDYAACVRAGEAGLALAPPYPMRNDLRLRMALARARADIAAGVPSPPLLAVPHSTAQISVIICSITAAKLERVTANYQRLLGSVPHEIIPIHDAQSLCEGYNRGARQARGDVLVFSHDDVEILSEDFAARLLRAMQQHDLVGVAGTDRLRGAAWMSSGWPHLHGQIGMPGDSGAVTVTAYGLHGRYGEGMQALDGVFLAARRELVEAVGFDARTFDGWHLYDLDFSWRAHRAGCRSATLNELLVVHQSGGNPDEAWRHQARRFLDKHRDIEGDLDLAPPPLTAVGVRSAEEWRRMTAWLISQRMD
jgi:hypothetical protein